MKTLSSHFKKAHALHLAKAEAHQVAADAHQTYSKAHGSKDGQVFHKAMASHHAKMHKVHTAFADHCADMAAQAPDDQDTQKAFAGVDPELADLVKLEF